MRGIMGSFLHLGGRATWCHVVTLLGDLAGLAIREIGFKLYRLSSGQVQCI